MSQPIDVGTVLGGRYQVTELVLTSADGDAVLGGMDQVLNRPVSILVAAPENASQVATSAREIATGERYGTMQVLDLGISDGSTYLITNTASPADLLDLVIQRDAPFVEPFYTDTLGSEIFGVTRSAEPEVYEDEDEYWEELQANEERNVGGRVAKRLTGLTNRLGRGKKDGDDGAAGQTPSDTLREEDATPEQEGDDGEGTAPTAAAPAVPQRPQEAPRTPRTAAHPVAAPQPDQNGSSERVSHWGAADEAAREDVPSPEDVDTANGDVVSPGTAAAAATARPASPERPVGAGQDGYERPAAVFPAGARDFSAEHPEEEYAEDDTDDRAGGGRFTRVLVGVLLVAVLIVGVVIAFNTLGKDNSSPVAGASSQAQSSDAGADDSASSEPPTSAPAVKPEIAGIERLVPGNQKLNSETDAKLTRAIDGSQGSIYRTYTYTTPEFGGFASNMVFVVELKEEAKVSELELTGLNGKGGSFQVNVGGTDDLGAAQEVASGSFTGPTVTVPISGDGGEPVTGKYVFINVTELPRLASTSNSSRPYGLQVAEIKVS
ncbi:ABC transporter substrate-binding protein [Arthrobacter sp. JSM 101049]|uniref:ABC transporter substrate-binding protein n=1 Tax=Arthrobacter sp. JSM 101049 TaxID=929097 RepID=UPI003565B881